MAKSVNLGFVCRRRFRWSFFTIRTCSENNCVQTTNNFLDLCVVRISSRRYEWQRYSRY
jgi:hypothetical protein